MYLIVFLHQTTTDKRYNRTHSHCILSSFYIKPQPAGVIVRSARNCILSSFYIKPQLPTPNYSRPQIVSYRLSTSNHNSLCAFLSAKTLYLIVFLHQTTTLPACKLCCYRLYLIVFLHQTTTAKRAALIRLNCILSSFYIKPQLLIGRNVRPGIVSYRLSTSNHNLLSLLNVILKLYLIVFLHQTTTVKILPLRKSGLYLIVFLHQTTTLCSKFRHWSELYLIVFLHQTTTIFKLVLIIKNCILSSFYIKPQQASRYSVGLQHCILSSFYIKPQPASILAMPSSNCILSSFYIKPQL